MEKSSRTRKMERYLATSHWWLPVLGLAGALVVAAVINLFGPALAVKYAVCELIIAAVLIGLYMRSVRRIKRVMDASEDDEIQA